MSPSARTNTGDRPVRDDGPAEHRHRGHVVNGVTHSPDGGTDQLSRAADFLTVAPELDRGQEAGFIFPRPAALADQAVVTVNQPDLPGPGQRQWTPDYGEICAARHVRFRCPVAPPDQATDFGPLLHRQKRRRRSRSPCAVGRWPTGPGRPRTWYCSWSGWPTTWQTRAGQRRPADILLSAPSSPPTGKSTSTALSAERRAWPS